MSGVDVLAVLDEALNDCQWLLRNSTKTMEVTPSALTEARAAVAELIAAHRELLTDVSIAQANMRRAAAYDPKWEGCAEAIQPRVDAAKAALNRVSGGEA